MLKPLWWCRWRRGRQKLKVGGEGFFFYLIFFFLGKCPFVSAENKNILVLLYASVDKFFVSCMRDFFRIVVWPKVDKIYFHLKTCPLKIIGNLFLQTVVYICERWNKDALWRHNSYYIWMFQNYKPKLFWDYRTGDLVRTCYHWDNNFCKITALGSWYQSVIIGIQSQHCTEWVQCIYSTVSCRLRPLLIFIVTQHCTAP